MLAVVAMTLLLRFLFGGLFVSLFAVLGESLKPKSFAGLFGAAPSIALSGFILEWLNLGVPAVSTEARSMIIGSIALILYSFSCALLIRHTKMQSWLMAGLLWLEWAGVTFLLYRINAK